jgi:hypothetical protein
VAIEFDCYTNRDSTADPDGLHIRQARALPLLLAAALHTDAPTHISIHAHTYTHVRTYKDKHTDQVVGIWWVGLSMLTASVNVLSLSLAARTNMLTRVYVCVCMCSVQSNGREGNSAHHDDSLACLTGAAVPPFADGRLYAAAVAYDAGARRLTVGVALAVPLAPAAALPPALLSAEVDLASWVRPTARRPMHRPAHAYTRLSLCLLVCLSVCPCSHDSWTWGRTARCTWVSRPRQAA